MSSLARYQHALATIPAPGGNGCHTALLGVATLGIMSSLSTQQIFEDIRASIPAGNRRVPDSEITAAIQRACQDTQPLGEKVAWQPIDKKPETVNRIPPNFMQRVMDQHADVDEANLWESSPIRLYDEPSQDAELLLHTLYRSTDVLFIGDRTDTQVRPVAQWRDLIKTTGTDSLPHICPNPMTGQLHPTKSGGTSFRGDASVAAYRFCIAEFDTMKHAEQIVFWANIALPIAALIDSGSKSIHAWIRTDGINMAKEWERHIRRGLYDERLVPLGVDSACRNESRLSRLPGHFRKEKNRWQRLLYLNPNPAPQPIIKGFATA